jgi:hypothetical protein
VTRPEPIIDMFRKVKADFGKLDIFVSNARPEVPAFFQPPLDSVAGQVAALPRTDGRVGDRYGARDVGRAFCLPPLGDTVPKCPAAPGGIAVVSRATKHCDLAEELLAQRCERQRA